LAVTRAAGINSLIWAILAAGNCRGLCKPDARASIRIAGFLNTQNFQFAFSHEKRQMKGMAETPQKGARTPNAAFMKPGAADETLAKVASDKPGPRQS
jgi:hypothetical protein